MSYVMVARWRPREGESAKIEAIRARGVKFGEYHINYHPRIGEVKLQKWRDGFHNLFFLVKKRFA